MTDQTEITLDDLRKSLDNLDNALMYILSERFRVTDKVGILKKIQGLSSVDPKREARQFERIEKIATDVDLDPAIAKKVLRLIIDEVVKRHEDIKKGKIK